MNRLTVYNERRGMVEIEPLKAYTPRLENAAEAIGELLVLMRQRGDLTHDQAMRICGNHEVYEDEPHP